MRFWRPAALVLLCLAAASDGRAQLAKTHPSHYGGGVAAPGGAAGPGLPDYRMKNPRSRVVLRRRRGLKDSGRPDTKLTQACRNGEFRQLSEHRFVALLDDKVYGAAIGNHGSLIDPRRLARQRIIYIFVGQGTTNCRVYSMGAFQG